MNSKEQLFNENEDPSSIQHLNELLSVQVNNSQSYTGFQEKVSMQKQ